MKTFAIVTLIVIFALMMVFVIMPINMQYQIREDIAASIKVAEKKLEETSPQDDKKLDKALEQSTKTLSINFDFYQIDGGYDFIAVEKQPIYSGSRYHEKFIRKSFEWQAVNMAREIPEDLQEQLDFTLNVLEVTGGKLPKVYTLPFHYYACTEEEYKKMKEDFDKMTADKNPLSLKGY